MSVSMYIGESQSYKMTCIVLNWGDVGDKPAHSWSYTACKEFYKMYFIIFTVYKSNASPKIASEKENRKRKKHLVSFAQVQ